jgi:hypothetical protein
MSKFILTVFLCTSFIAQSADRIEQLLSSAQKERVRAPDGVLTRDARVPRLDEMLKLEISKNPMIVKRLLQVDPAWANATEVDEHGRPVLTILMLVVSIGDVKGTQLLLEHNAVVEATTTRAYEYYGHAARKSVALQLKRIKRKINLVTGNESGDTSIPPTEKDILNCLNALIHSHKPDNIQHLQAHLPQIPRGVIALICDYGWQSGKEVQENYSTVERGLDYIVIDEMLAEKNRKQIEKRHKEMRRVLTAFTGQDLPDA